MDRRESAVHAVQYNDKQNGWSVVRGRVAGEQQRRRMRGSARLKGRTTGGADKGHGFHRSYRRPQDLVLPRDVI